MFLRSKTGFWLSIIVLISLIVYSGCKKSDSSTNPVNPVSQIAGKWVLTKVTVKNPDNSTTSYTPAQAGVFITMEFRNDNTATITTSDSTGTTTESGTYTYSSGQLHLTNTSGEMTTIDIALIGNKFTTTQTLTDDNGNPVAATLEFTKQ